ncbi:MAG: PilN domain-containing protein [Tepidisphaeraceae bacterium]
MGAPNELSFLPDDYLERKGRRRANAICAILFFVVVSAIAGAFTVTERSMREIDQQHAKVTDQYTDAAKRIVQVQQMQEKQRTMAHQAELTASLLEKMPRSFILAEITNDIPTGVSLIDFQLSSTVMANATAAAAKTAFEIRQAQLNGGSPIASIQASQPRVYDVLMKLSGVASNDVQVAQFIAKLNAAKKFQDVNLIFTDEFKLPDTETKMRKFEIELKLNPHATVDSKDVAAAEKVINNKTAALPLEQK